MKTELKKLIVKAEEKRAVAYKKYSMGKDSVPLTNAMQYYMDLSNTLNELLRGLKDLFRSQLIKESTSLGDDEKEGCEMEKIPFRIFFPVVRAYSSENYGLIIEDASGVIHYWDFDGNYDGYSHDTCKDVNTKTDMN